tara:strand:- start:316 stop:609 length:294 start_codon:yes stop_codon:yes gene_type:complete
MNEQNNLDIEFENAIKEVNNINNINNINKIDDKIKLKFYKYYKQATIGDCNTLQPYLIDFKNKIKWEAWNSIKGMSSNKAKYLYIMLFQSINNSNNN